MCWTTKNTPVKEIAQENMVVYKRLGVIYTRKWYTFWKKTPIAYTSEIYGYRYEPYGFNPPVNLNPEPIAAYSGMHTKIEAGYHSYEEPPYPNPFFSEHRAVKCIIPKGSVYYINDHGELVSSHLVVTDKIVKYPSI